MSVLFHLGAKTKLVLMDVSYDKLGDGKLVNFVCIYGSHYQKAAFDNNTGDKPGITFA